MFAATADELLTAWRDDVAWNRREGRVSARRQETFGALVLDERPWPEAPPEAG